MQEEKTVIAAVNGHAESNGAVVGAHPAPPTGDPRPQTTMEVVLSWVKTIAMALLIVIIIHSVLIASVMVPTGSMENEVMAGDFLFVNKFIYGGSTPQIIPILNVPIPYARFPGIREPEKGDVIVFIYPGNRDQVEPSEFQYYLKRCVATAGDTLLIREKRLFINGELQPNPPNATFLDRSPSGYDLRKTFPEDAGFTRDNWGPMRIPKQGDVIPLNDSTYMPWRVFIEREGHEIERNGELILIDGVVAFSYTVERDYCFGMGDNRDNSDDSRYWGFIPVDDVIGTPLFVYWSWDPNVPMLQFGDKLGSIRWGRIFEGID